jgi:hypothetical protein
VEHAATDVLAGAGDVGLVEAVVAAVAVPAPLPVLLVALVVGFPAGRAPQQAALEKEREHKLFLKKTFFPITYRYGTQSCRSSIQVNPDPDPILF